MMSKMKPAAIALVASAFLFSCSQLFDFNLFKDLDPVPAPNAADYEGSEGLDQLDDDLDSPAVVDALADDPDTVAAIEDMLEEDYLNDGVSGEEDQQAAIVYADLNLETSGGDELVNNIVATVLGGIDPATQTMVDLLKQIVPPEAAGNRDAFCAMLLAFLDAHYAYQLLGNSIVDVNGDGVISAGEGVPAAANMGDVAQKAVVSYILDQIITQIVTAYPALTQADAALQLFLLLYEPTSPELVITDLPAPDDPFAADPAASGLMYLKNIFDAAGLPFMAQM